MNIFVIILHYGTLETTNQCVASLLKHETNPFSLLVVNNTREALTPLRIGRSKKIKIINNKKNLGFAKGVNVGIAYALKHNADVICLLNNDTIIVKPIIADLVKELDNKNIGIVGPSIEFLKNEKKFFDIGGKVNTLFLRTSHKEVAQKKLLEPFEVTYVSGCCMAIRKDVFKKIGFFDESFFLYYEDADFCLRAKKAGYKTYIVPSVVVKHALSKSVGKMSDTAIYYLLTSAIIFGEKYATTILRKVCNRIFILTQAGLFLKANPRSWTVIAKALLG